MIYNDTLTVADDTVYNQGVHVFSTYMCRKGKPWNESEQETDEMPPVLYLTAFLLRWHAPYTRRLLQSTRQSWRRTRKIAPSCGIAPLPCTIWAGCSLTLPPGQLASC